MKLLIYITFMYEREKKLHQTTYFTILSYQVCELAQVVGIQHLSVILWKIQ